MVEAGYAEARRGAGTFTRVPGGRARTHDRALLPRAGDADAIDLNCAAPLSPPGIAPAYEAAVAELPAYLTGHGYYPAGLPRLQQAIAATYDARGLPTDPDQIMVTAGALSAAAIVSGAFTGPGQRVLVETPVYPNATESLRHHGARLVGSPVDPDGWDLDVVAAGLRQHAPTLAYLIPDFQNPTGHLMPDAQREQYAVHLRRARTIAVVDEAHQALPLDGQPMPRPVRVVRPRHHHARQCEQDLLGRTAAGLDPRPARHHGPAHPGAHLPRPRRARRRAARARPPARGSRRGPRSPPRAPARATRRAGRRDLRTPSRVAVPRARRGAGAVVRAARATVAVALVDEAERRGVIVAPGPVFAVDGGLYRFVRVPWTRSVPELQSAVERLADAWAVVAAGDTGTRRTSRVMVA